MQGIYNYHSALRRLQISFTL